MEERRRKSICTVAFAAEADELYGLRLNQSSDLLVAENSLTKFQTCTSARMTSWHFILPDSVQPLSRRDR
jgi:hypothetical protein